MARRERISLLTALTAAAAAVAVPLALWLAQGAAPPPLWQLAALAVLPPLLPLALLWHQVTVGMLRPLTRWAGDIDALVQSRKVDRPLIEMPEQRLGAFTPALAALVDELRHARRENDEALALALSRIGEQKAWLEAILLDLSEGVVVCNTNHLILLYNQTAVRLLGNAGSVGLGRSLFSLLSRPPVLHALELLDMRGGGADGQAAPFVCATVDAKTMVRGRLAPIRNADGSPAGYVVSLADISFEMASLNKDRLIRRLLTRDLRRPIANLRAAAETIAEYPAMEPKARLAFDQVIIEECAALSERMEQMEADFRVQTEMRWMMADIHSQDLLGCLAKTLGGEDQIALTMAGLPLWLNGDSHGLLLALRVLAGRIARHAQTRSLDAEALLADRRVYIDLIWSGDPIPSATLERWLDEPLDGALGAHTLRDVMERHGAEPWCLPRPDGTARLRIPLPAPQRPQFAQPAQGQVPRPEFYDFDLMRAHSHTGALGGRRLVDLTYVVFDCETTGLSPTGGDRILSIGAIRVVNGRILSGETFERLVNPEKPIPKESIQFHGITDQMVQGKPTIAQVLPGFRDFVGDAVLVAHNAAFDLKFLQMQEKPTGIVFANPVLDTLLLAATIEPDGDHSLDGIARRYGIDIRARHTALADAQLAAEVLVRLFDQLEARGIHTFDQVMRASGMTAQLRTRSHHF